MGLSANEQAGRSLLPPLQNLFIPQCFLDPNSPSNDAIKSGIIKAQSSLYNCLITSIFKYGSLLIGVAAIICFAYIIRAGYIMFTAFGDEAKYAQGKKTLLYAIIGFAIAIASGFIISFFVKLLGYAGPNLSELAP